MIQTTRVHEHDYACKTYHPDGSVPWRDATPPDMAAGRTTGHMRSCQFCGSMHPADVAAAIRAGAKGSFADMKYGWPHKAYFYEVPYPFAGMPESRHSAGQPPQAEIDAGKWVQVPDGFSRTTGAPEYRWTAAPTPAAATTMGKFYSVHLQDASPEDRATIEQHLGLTFEFEPGGAGIGWKRVVEGDFSLGKACDLSGDGTCEACQ